VIANAGTTYLRRWRGDHDRQAERVRLAEGKVVEFGAFETVSTEWFNRAPWGTYREEVRVGTPISVITGSR
jgi:hypothetical protein